MKRHIFGRKGTAGVLAAFAIASIAAACGSSSSATSTTQGSKTGFTGTVTVAESTTLSGAISELGQGGLQGVQDAVANINANGGLLGKKVVIASADDATSPATGAANIRSMILNDHAVAIFGPVTSAVAAAEEPIAAQYHIPIFFHTSNDVALLTSGFTKYAFGFVPDTVMEPRAAAAYLLHEVGSKPITIGTISPDYSFGHATVSGFLQALQQLHVNYHLVVQQWPPLAATNIAPYLAAVTAAHPQYVFNAQFGGDLVNFTQQANQFGFFKNTKLIAMYSMAPLQALGANAPAGSIGFDRAAFWAINAPAMKPFIAQFKAKYSAYPSAWAIMAYTAVQSWAYAVEKAKTFDGTKVADALYGATVPTIQGAVTLRACDHQANVPEYVGTVASSTSSKYGLRLWNSPTFVAPPSQIMLTCAQSLALRG